MFGKWEEGGREEGSGGQIKVENLEGAKVRERREGKGMKEEEEGREEEGRRREDTPS